MTQRDVLIPTPDGTCDASLHTPVGDGPWPAVIMFPDAGGVRTTFHAMAQQLADLGYTVLLPNMYYRVSDFEPFDVSTVFSDPDERARLMAVASTVTKDAATCDTGAFLAFLAGTAGGGRHEGRYDRLLPGWRALAHRGGTLPRACGRGCLVPWRTDRQHGARQPAPAGRCHEGQGLRGRRPGRRLVRRRAVRSPVGRPDRGRRRAHAGHLSRRPTGSPFPTTLPTTRRRPAATGRPSPSSTRRRSPTSSPHPEVVAGAGHADTLRAVPTVSYRPTGDERSARATGGTARDAIRSRR